MAYEWEWLERDRNQILSIKLTGVATAEDTLKVISEALPSFGGGQLKVLCDVLLSERTIGYEGFLEILRKSERFGADETVVAMIVDDKYYDDKVDMFNAVADVEESKFMMRAFSGHAAAEQWLVDFSF